MQEYTAYHVVTERPMCPGQRLRFDRTHHNGVYARVTAQQDIVKEIYANPQRYLGTPLEHHTAVALRELAMEQVRQQEFPQYPSRMACLYVSETLEEAQRWAEFFAGPCQRPTYHIVRLHVLGSLFAGNACNCFDGFPDQAQNLARARNYWRNGPSPEGPPVKELLAAGDIHVLEILQEINQNLP